MRVLNCRRLAKTTMELARMVDADLAKHPECAREGFAVTVYGTALWRATLTITPAVGPVHNPQEYNTGGRIPRCVTRNGSLYRHPPNGRRMLDESSVAGRYGRR